MPFVATGTTADGCQCSELQILQAINQNLANGFTELLQPGGAGAANASVVYLTGSFNRPADTNNYAANDMVMNSTSAATLATILEAALAAGKGGIIQSVTLWKSGTLVTGAVFQVQFFSSASASIPGQDNAPENVLLGNAPFLVGAVDLPAMATGAGAVNSAAKAAATQVALPYVCATDTALRWAVKCLSAYTDEASGETFTLAVGLLRD